MLTQEATLTSKRTVDANPTEVFRAFTNTAALRDWLCNAAQVDPRRGGRIYLSWNDGYATSGTFTSLTRGESLAFTWQGPGEPQSTVQVDLTPAGDATEITLTHSGALPGDVARKLEKLWDTSLEHLQTLLETGNDLRLLRRPMFGLNGADEMTPELAEKLGVPVTEGLRLTGLVPGLGAEAAGFQKDDVVVAIGDREVANFSGFVAALDPHNGGDRIPVTIYRGAEKQVIDMELSRRPVPEFPSSVKAMTDTARDLYATLDKEMDALFEGVSEEAAERRPTPDEWNAKEVMAHLISSERDTQTWLAAITEDFDIEQPFHSNGKERIQAMAIVYNTIPALVEEMKKSEAVLIALASSLSPETLTHKHLVNQIASWLTTFEAHHREHFAEIKQLLSAEA